MKLKGTFLLLIIVSNLAQAQNYMPFFRSNEVLVEEAKIEAHLWLDNKMYQFIAISILDLPESNTRSEIVDIKNFKPDADVMGGGYAPPILITRKQTFQPVKTIQETVYDTLSKSNRVKHISLFLVDDFDKVKRNDSLLLISRGIFGYKRKSQAFTTYFVCDIKVKKSLLKPVNGFPIADKKWYQKWLENAPKTYEGPRERNYSYPQHQNFENYFKKEKLNASM